MYKILLISLFAFILNVPFGYLRSHTKKYSFKWFLFIHVPVPFVILTRLLIHADYNYIPFFVLSSIVGQFLGGKIESSNRCSIKSGDKRTER